MWDIFTGKIFWEKHADSPQWQQFVVAAVSPDGRLFALPDRVTGICVVNAQT